MSLNRRIALGVAAISILIPALVWSGAVRTVPDPRAREILTQFEKKEGFVPKPLKLMGHRADLLGGFMTYGKGIFDGGPLSEKERSLVALSAAVALKSPDCIRAHSGRARRAGAGEDEVVQTLLIAGLISHTSPLHVAYEAAGIGQQPADGK